MTPGLFCGNHCSTSITACCATSSSHITAPAEWASDLQLMPAGSKSEVDGYIGYFEPYSSGHEALDRDVAFQAEVRNAALALMEAVEAKRAGRLPEPGAQLKDPRPK